MPGQLVHTLEDLLENSPLAHLDPTLSAIVSILTIGTVLISGVKLCFRCLRTLTRQKPIDRLYKALIGHSVVSKAEVIYQVQNYRKPRFADKKTIRQLRRQILECSGDKPAAAAVFSVIGAPACGKTTTMRYLYCQLSRSRNCVYFQMQDVGSMEKLSRYLDQQRADSHFKNDAPVIAFFDGLDEAYAFFRKENSKSMKDAFQSIFFSGLDSKICEVFRNNKLNLNCIVISLRPEFLERSKKSLTELQYKNISSRLFRILPISDHDAIKIFKSLRKLKKLEARGSEEKKRHQNRYPPRWRTYHYTRMLRRVLRDNPNCLFHYPMYIRYAYAYMQEYEKRLPYEEWALSDNIAVSFDILLDAIIKWEFHIYYENKSAELNREEKEKFKQNMERLAQAVVLELPEDGAQNLPAGKFKDLIQHYFQDEPGRLAAHCLMVSDDEGKYFTFCHRTFYEYFLGKYLFEKADYKCRKERLFSETGSENLRLIYYSILCRNEELNTKISESVRYISSGMLNPVRYKSLERNGWMDIREEPEISLVEILEYLPCIESFQYHEREFTRESLEKLMDGGTLDLHETGWDSLDYVKGIIPLARIKKLNIDGLHLRDVSALRDCGELECLEMRFPKEDDPLLEQILDQLRKLSLLWIHIASRDGVLCRRIYERIDNGTLCVRQIFVQTPNYSTAHLEMYRLNQEWKKFDKSVRFYPSVRSCLEKAENIFSSKHDEKDPEMLTAVFELEADDSGMLGLEQKNSEATYWNGLSLAVYYQHKDYLDEDDQAIRIYRRLEPYIAKDSSKLSAEFGLLYGQLLTFKHENMLSEIWLANAYYQGREHLSENKIIECGVRSYKVQIRLRKKDLDELTRELEARIRKQKNYQTNWLYALFLRYNCARQLEFWQRGESVPENLQETIVHYKKISDLRSEKGFGFFEQFNFRYFNAVYANRSENLNLGEQTLKEMSKVLESYIEKSNEDVRNKQAAWIQYHEQKLYHALLLNDRETVLDTVEKLLNYPYRKGDISTKKCKIIQKAYQETDYPDIDKHQLWNIIWY